MNNLKSLIIILSLMFALPWFALIVYPTVQMKGLVIPQEYAEGEETAHKVFPEGRRAVTRGSEVYAKNGCAYCHTQMIRPTYAGADMWRPGWGGDELSETPTRETRPHDFLGENYAHLGIQRNGPDLSNVGYRIKDKNWHFRHFYDPRSEVPGSIMPPYRNLFETQEVIGQVSESAVDVFEKGSQRFQVVPNGNGKALVDYLLSMKKDQQVPEGLVVR